MKINLQNYFSTIWRGKRFSKEPELSGLHYSLNFFLQQQKAIIVAAFVPLLLLLITGCKDPYNVKVQSSQQSVLVVEGFLNSGGITSIKLSHSFGLNDGSASTMETGASVLVESTNAQYPLIETSAGLYIADLSSLDPSQEYRLHINANGNEYVSDYIKPKSTPAIDSVSWRRDEKGVTVYANTHDPANASHYYRYEYEETWETHARYLAYWMYDPVTKTVGKRDPNNIPYQCWKNQFSSNINLATSTALQSDVIFEKPLIFLSNGDEKLNVRYSVLVKQYVLSKEAYEFFQLMKKNTESLGTVFDPQPSEITGNIHPLNDQASRVIGFFYASSEQQKRIFIDASQVPEWHYTYNCSSQLIGPGDDAIAAAVADGLYPYDAKVAGILIVGYYVSVPECFDCTITGGNRTKPSFW